MWESGGHRGIAWDFKCTVNLQPQKTIGEDYECNKNSETGEMTTS